MRGEAQLFFNFFYNQVLHPTALFLLKMIYVESLESVLGFKHVTILVHCLHTIHFFHK